MAAIGQRNNFRLGFWAFTLMEESSKPGATLSRKISGSRIFSFRFPNFRYSLPFSACQHVRVSAFAPNISAFAFPLSGAHSPHGDKLCQ
jgi:hypothetical protein